MKHLITLPIFILSLLFIGAGRAYCDDDTNPYLSTTEGSYTYKLIETLNDYSKNNIIIVASYTTDPQKVQIMTTAATASDHTGEFAYYTYGDYGTEMPQFITLNKVNRSVNDDNKDPFYPYEYQTIFTEDDRTNSVPNWQIELKDVNDKYISAPNSNGNVLTMESTHNAAKCKFWIYKPNEIPTLFCNNNSKILRCQTDGYFKCSGSTNKESCLYKKVYPVTITSFGYATLYYGTHDLVVPEGLTCYTYKIENNALAISNTIKAGNVIPAGTAVVVKGEASDTPYYFDIIANQSTALSGDNYLHGTDAAEITTAKTASNETTTNDCYFYYLTSGASGFGFRWKTANGAAFTNNAHKAYLCIPKSVTNAKELSLLFPFVDDPTAIATVSGDNDNALSDKKDSSSTPLSNICYDLSGRRIAEPQHGTFIKQGKKIIK